MVKYLDHSTVQAVRVADAPRHGRTVTGYGPKIPSRFMVRVGNRWHRVYVAQYGNSGSAYVVIGGEDRYLDTDTEHDLMRLA